MKRPYLDKFERFAINESGSLFSATTMLRFRKMQFLRELERSYLGKKFKIFVDFVNGFVKVTQ